MHPVPSLIERFPPLDLDEVVERIRAFEAAHAVERAETLHRFVAAHPVLAYDWGRDWRYRRARKLDGEDRVKHVDGLIWRKDVSAPIGRANSEGFPILYLADRRDTALREVHAENERVILSEFSIRPGSSIRVAPVGEMMQVQRTGRGFLAGDASQTINDLLNACEQRGCRSMLMVDAFLYESLTNREDDYALSSAIAMAIFEKLPELRGVAFSSRRQSGAINFAVRTERLWEDWGIVSVREAQARHLAMGFYELSGVRHVSGITHGGDLVWDDVVEDDERAVMLLDPPWHPVSSGQNNGVNG